MVKVEPTELLNLEEIKARVQKLRELVNNLKTNDLIRAKQLELIRQEKLLLEQQLSAFKLDIENARMQSKLVISESRVLN